MDATMLTILTVLGTGLTAIGVGVGLFRTLWKALEAQTRRFDAMERRIDQRFEAVYQQFETSNKQWAERFEVADQMNRERFEVAEKANRELFKALEGRFDDLCRHLLDAPPPTARLGAPADRQESAS